MQGNQLGLWRINTNVSNLRFPQSKAVVSCQHLCPQYTQRTLTPHPSASITSAAAPRYVTSLSYAAAACLVVLSTRMEFVHKSDVTDAARPIPALLSSFAEAAAGIFSLALR